MRDLSTERWLRLVHEAEWCARRPELDPDTLRISTGKLYGVAPPNDLQKRNACHALRTAAQWFAFSDPLKRVRLSRALELLAHEAALVLNPPDPDPAATAAALPVPAPEPANEPEAPAWTRRADLA